MSDDEKPRWPELNGPDQVTENAQVSREITSSVPTTAPPFDLATAEDRMAGKQQWDLEYHGQRKDIRRMLFRHALLLFGTVGTYWFWSRTNVRRYVWGHLSVGGSRLEYGGRGIELFVGFVIAGLAVALLLWALQYLILASVGPLRGQAVWLGVLYIFFSALGVLAIYSRHRYMLRRTTWRGIHCDVAGSPPGFAARVAIPLLVTVLTLGFTYPWLAVSIQRYLVRNMSVGTLRFAYSGRGSEIMMPWLACWFLLPFTMGLSLAWWRGYALRYHLNKMQLGPLRFETRLRPWRIFRIYVLGTILASLLVYGTVFVLTGIIASMSGVMVEFVDPTGLVINSPTFTQMTALLPSLVFSLLIVFPISYVAFLYLVSYMTLEHVFETTVIRGLIDPDQVQQVQDRRSGPGDGLDILLGMDGI
ncbi:MAG: DUF898 family protein [Minwuia sp.]|nr:DUF898 family protein [Minwuia sp.]